ncbi:MAG: FAD-dependent oxidoreductase [Phycisphaeraceae bacterium]
MMINALACVMALLFAGQAAAQQETAAARTDLPSYFKGVERGEPKQLDFDVAVYGGTPGGVTAAIQASRMGKRVVLLSFDDHVGGLTSGGLTATDLGKAESIGGMALDFYGRLKKKTGFSPSEAEAAFRTMLDEAGVTVLLRRPLESANVKDARIESITMLTGETVSAKMFVDASYEGDLYAAAGVSYRVGREPRSAFDETLAGTWQKISYVGVYMFCDLPLSPYVVADDPSSGLLPEISDEPAGEPGLGDFKVQAYNFRMHLTNKARKVPFPKPDGYDPGRYALLARFMNHDPTPTWTLHYTTKKMTDGPVQMRNGDSNNAGSFSSDYIGGNYKWPDGTYEPVAFEKMPPPRRGLSMPMAELYELREAIFQDHINYQVGMMYFLANDPQVPEGLQARVNKFGLDPNEFKNTGHWPHQLYVREGRRMVSDYIINQHDCQHQRKAKDSVGLASYMMDSHHCSRRVVEIDGKMVVRNEGNLGTAVPGPYRISYRAIVPKEKECENLLVPVCLSASHIAYGSIRMEPVFMILGQSAGTAASMAIDQDISVQDVDYQKLRKRLLADGQKLD